MTSKQIADAINVLEIASYERFGILEGIRVNNSLSSGLFTDWQTLSCATSILAQELKNAKEREKQMLLKLD